ncbi:MAG: DUF2179 domain-containing protein [Acholeplasmataceae bacterium]|jgi:uncharacterized protein YebE (UPF0316 family)|nr:DUF2179 domain-containing protein [Acholeplasmataceae bacterium]
MLDFLRDFFTSTPAWELLLIFFAKIVEVSFATLRIILINKGNRKVGFFLALVEIFLWVFIASNVITDLKSSPIKAVMYGLGFSVGVYLGSLIEEKLAFGRVLVQAIVPKEIGLLIANTLRETGFGVTSIDGEGREKKRSVLLLFINRKDEKTAVKIIKSIDDNAMIISHESTTLSGGFTNRIRQMFK